jgi:hypothetical protein
MVEPKLVNDHAQDVVRVAPWGGLPTSTWVGLLMTEIVVGIMRDRMDRSVTFPWSPVGVERK